MNTERLMELSESVASALSDDSIPDKELHDLYLKAAEVANGLGEILRAMMAVDEVLDASYRFDDKPHRLFWRIVNLARIIKHKDLVEIERLMNKAADRR